ncbi:MAG: transcription factor FapR [Firmicutes bacterium]|nr:transcription factor FapR [Bacillota bacterium]
MASGKELRRQQLQSLLHFDPFLNDHQLADKLDVSVATIRLDRMALNIPELRERTKEMAAKNYAKLKALEGYEIIGELIDLEIGEYGISLLSVTNDMIFERTNILRGHYLFAQGNSLAVALVDAKVALTAAASVKYLKPVKKGERVVAKASLTAKSGSRHTIHVEGLVNRDLVFKGEYVVVAFNKKEGDFN